MNGYNFTERTRKVLAIAREEALARRHEYVGSEHILLALVAEGEGVAAAVLQNRGVDGEALRVFVDSARARGESGRATGSDLPYTSVAKRVLERAMSEARRLKHSYVGTEHLLLALTLVESIAREALLVQDFRTESATTETLRLLGTEPPAADDRGLAPARRAGRHAVQQMQLVFAATHVVGFSEACAARGDIPTFEALRTFHSMIADLTSRTDGRFIKLMGDGALMAFQPGHTRQLAVHLREFQKSATTFWSGFDSRCRVQVRVGTGSVAAGFLGDAFDIAGDSLNKFFRGPWSDFDVSPDVQALFD
jgi:class 3 adenylate cyclase